MALAVQANNPEILTALETVLGDRYTRIVYSFFIKENQNHLIWGSGGMHRQQGRPEITLDLKFYIDQNALLSKEDLFTSIESKLSDLMLEVDGVYTGRDGVYTGRVVVPFRETDAVTVTYTVKLVDYDNFIYKLNIMARRKSDIEFTKALDSKLSED